MVELIKTYKQSVPATRFIGKKYKDEDRINGTFASKWGEWFEQGWFELLEKNNSNGDFFEDSGAYIGLMRFKEGELFEYWIGMFCPENTTVPEGFDSVDFKESNLGVTWVKGQEPEVYCKEDLCAESCMKAGLKITRDEQGILWFFERYTCPRFTTSDSDGNVILDICYFVE